MATPSISEIQSQARMTASQYGISAPIFMGLIEKESSWNIDAANPKSTAYGLTQLLKGTATDLGVDRSDWRQQLDGGARYLKAQIDKFGDIDTALAAYYQGPGSVARKGVTSGGSSYARDILARSTAYQSAKGAIEKSLGIVTDTLDKVGTAITDSVGTVSKAIGLDSYIKRGAIGVVGVLMIGAAIMALSKSSVTDIASAVLKTSK